MILSGTSGVCPNSNALAHGVVWGEPNSESLVGVRHQGSSSGMRAAEIAALEPTIDVGGTKTGLAHGLAMRRPASACEMPPEVLGVKGSKRLMDVVVAGAGLLLLLPLIAVVALTIKLESRGPVFYRCRRVGLGGHEFSMLKFRKMLANAAGPPLTAADDERFTRIGRLLATTKVDEIPQLWNVLTGSMSLVGPRPEDPSFVALRRADYDRILRVKPGITGLSQLAFVRESGMLDADDPVADYARRLLPQKMLIDRLYVTRRSILTDMRILVWTGITIFFRSQVAIHRVTGRISPRRRPSQPVLEPRQLDGAVS